MHTTIGVVISKPDDYKICLDCGSINWYENDMCYNCYSNQFREISDDDIKNIMDAIEDGIYCCEDLPIDV